MESDLISVGGTPVDPDQLEIPRANDLARAVRDNPFAELVECRKIGATEVVIFDVDVEIPQIREHDIRRRERISVGLDPADAAVPEVLALRQNFPQVPHLNLRSEEFPRSLCLYDERWEEIKHRWTAPRFIEQIREWLRLTARGELHQEDQPLEPLILHCEGHLVLPRSLMRNASSVNRLFITLAPHNGKKPFLIARDSLPPGSDDGSNLQFVATVHIGKPQTHGVIHSSPQSLADLGEFASNAGISLISELRESLHHWCYEDERLFDSRLVIVLLLPKRRQDTSKPETLDTWAFMTSEAVHEVASAIDAWAMEEVDGRKIPGTIIRPDPAKRGEDIRVGTLNCSYELDREAASILNGLGDSPNPQIVCIGVGALGSQVVMNSARTGFGSWTLIDNDTLMPHNTARHALFGSLVGYNKAQAVSGLATTICNNENFFTPLPIDALNPGERGEDLLNAFEDADAIVDMSTSIAVARMLACEIEATARRVSLFLTPAGNDLVMLAEDQGRAAPIDALEMQYYRAVAADTSLEGHFDRTDDRHRYAQSCRDITSTLPQHLVGMHSAIGANALRQVLDSQYASIIVWRADDAGNVNRVDVDVSDVVCQQDAEWTIVSDKQLLVKISDLRQSRLPNETGGVLLGSIDLEQKRIYIVDALPSPPDSREWPTLYIRGCRGLREDVAKINRTTHGALDYIGEWHSHPIGVPTNASPDDLRVLEWIHEKMQKEGLPGTMLITGDAMETRCLLIRPDGTQDVVLKDYQNG